MHFFLFQFFPLLIGILITGSSSFAQRNIVVPRMEEYLAQNEISFKECHGAESYENLIKLFDLHIDYCEEEIKNGDNLATPRDYGIHDHLPKIEKDDKEKLLPYLKTGREMLLEKRFYSNEDPDRQFSCYLASRLLYTFKALAHARDPRSSKETRRVFESIVLPNKINYPKSKKTYKEKILNKKQEQNESRFLEGVALKSRNQGKNKEGRTALEYSEIDIREDDPFFYSDRFIRGKSGDQLAQDFFTKIETAMSRWVQKKHGDQSLQYKISDRPKTFFFKKIKGVFEGNGAHPKMKVFDSLKVEHKLKLGEERAAEAIVNYLHLAIGGKFADVNVLHTYQNPIVILFEKQSEKSTQNYIKLLDKNFKPEELDKLCNNITSYTMFKTCFEQSRYHLYNLDRFIMEHGTISEENQQRLIHFERSPIKEFNDLIGREYIVFKEASTELKNDKIFFTGGGVALSNMGALEDRSLRSQGLFHMFVDNLDAKDVNFKGVVLNPDYFPEVRGKEARFRYLEYPSDTGAALGRFYFSSPKRKVIDTQLPVQLMENRYTNKHFLIKEPLTGDTLWYTNTNLYKPLAWEKATVADNLWMARRMVKQLSDQVIKNAVYQVNMPEMWKRSMVWRIIKRRDQLGHYFRLDPEKLYEKSKKIKLSYSLSLATLEERKSVAENYQIPLEEIHKEMRQRHLIINDDDSCTYSDPVLYKGKVSTPKSSLINAILDNYYPSGIGF